MQLFSDLTQSDYSAKLNLFLKIILFLIMALGIYLRLNQFLIQTLMDDEWHAVHQLLTSTPSEIAASFGYADYSIPLTLFYWLESKIFGLSELMMRWPMMLMGIATLILFPVYSKKHVNLLIVNIFAFFIAISPVLIEYSRIARPYAITLFLVYFSILLFYKCYQSKNNALRFGLLYLLTASLAIWLHLIVVFFIAAPFIFEFIKTLVIDKPNIKNNTVKLLKLGIPTLLLTALLIGPPLFNDMAAISSKAGNNLPDSNTLIAFLYLCYGTKSSLLVLLMGGLSLIGIYPLLKTSRLAVNIVVGFGLTVLVILILQPAWVQVPITFTRYVLPIIPLMLLSAAMGLYYIMHLSLNTINQQWLKGTATAVLLAFVMMALIIHSPLKELIKKPNSNTLHSVYAIDFRDDKNIILDILKSRPLSPFWASIKDQPMDSKIALAPWFFESYNWDGPVWEKASQHYVVPGMLINLCIAERKGEIPNNPQFSFKNLAYLADQDDLLSKNIQWIVYQKPTRFKTEVNYKNLEDCQQSLKDLYGQPVYEDGLIAVFTPN